MARSDHSTGKRLASNRRALHDYFVVERIEAGIELKGTEVKSIRNGEVTLVGAFARVVDGEVTIYQMTVAPYAYGNRYNPPSDRPRRLLLHRREIHSLQVQTEQKGHALIPLSVYLKRGRVKVEIGVCRGKRQTDKRETLRRRTADREAERAIAGREH